MNKYQGEALIILLDLNSFNLMREHHEDNQNKKKANENQVPYDSLKLEGIIEYTILQFTAHVSMGEENIARYMIFDENDCKVVFPCGDHEKILIKMMNYIEIKKKIRQKIYDYLVSKQLSTNPYSKVIKALSKSLCFLNYVKEAETKTTISNRIFLVYNSQIDPEKFNELMNLIFVCQHREIVIDAFILNSKKHQFLRQATNKTNGLFIYGNKSKSSQEPMNRGILQYFLQGFLISGYERENFYMPQIISTEFSATCSCHNETINLGWICSVCFAIYCKREKEATKGICKFCKVRYDKEDFNIKVKVEV